MLAPTSPTSESILAIHGFGSKRLWMAPLSYRLRRMGYGVENWGYSTLWSSIATHAVRLRKHLLGLCPHKPRLHIVAHSMGSVLVRIALQGERIENIGKIVFLAPPSHGSPAATVVGSTGLGRICPPLAELSTNDVSFVNSIVDSNDYDIGVIAAKYDVLVPVSRTHLQSEADHIVLNATHNSLLFSVRASNCVHEFLETGAFHHV